LFRNDLTLYVYPLRDAVSGALTTVENYPIAPQLRGLYDHLVARGAIRQLENYDPQYLPIFSRDVLDRIVRRDPSFESAVPTEVARVIRERELLGWQERLLRAG
jgi:hypothetical protein